MSLQDHSDQKEGLRAVMTLAWPSIFENIMVTMVSFVDTAMVGALGAAATSAVAINASPTWLINSLSTAVSVGGTVMVARHWGADNRLRAGDYGRQALTLGAMLGLVVSLIVFLIAPSLPRWMGGDASILPDAGAYMRIMSFAFLPHYVGLTISGLLRGSGDTKTPMRVSLMTNVGNIIGNCLLIYPTREVSLFGERFTLWGAGMGVSGAALSSAVAMGLSGLFLLLYLARQQNELRFSFKLSYRPRSSELRSILRIGLPAAGERVVISLGHTLFTTVVAGLGVQALAAHHLAITAESICYNPAYGFSTAATTMVGQSMGARDPERAARLGRLNIRLGAITMVGLSIILFVFAKPLMGLFTPDQEVIELGARMLRIVAFAEPFFALAIVASGALRGAGDTLAPLLIGVACMWGIRLTLAFVCVRIFNMGLHSAWIAMSIDLTIRGMLTYLRFRRGAWKTQRTF